MNLIPVLLIGFFVGAVAKFVMPGKQPHGCIVTMLLGIAGAWVGQAVLTSLGVGHAVGFIGSVLGAMLILFVYQLLRKD